MSRIVFDQEASSLVVFEYVPSEAEKILSAQNNWLTVLEVFEDKDRYIEPNEIVERQTLIALPRISNIGYQLEFRVFSDSGYAWRTTTVVQGLTFEDNEAG